jgi:RimJ/RimL family protein N-acetyltransferase
VAKLVIDETEAVARWVGAQVSPLIEDFGPCVSIGVASKDGKLLAGAVYNDWTPPNIQITFAVGDKRWASRAAIACILSYPFVQLGCLRITAVTAVGNDRARAFLTNPLIGFKQEGYHPNWFPDSDAVSYGLLRKDCQWVNLDGQRCP